MFFMAGLSAICLAFPVNPSVRAADRLLAGIPPLPNDPEFPMDVLQVFRDQCDRLGGGILVVGGCWSRIAQ